MMSTEPLNAFSMDFFSLKGKTALVTGGNRGLGQAFAVALAKAGANILSRGLAMRMPAPASSSNCKALRLNSCQWILPVRVCPNG